MSNFKFGDEVWFFCHDSDRCWGEGTTVIFPGRLEINSGIIVFMNEDRDYVHVYVKGVKEIVNFGFTFHEDYFYASCEDAIASMTHALQNL